MQQTEKYQLNLIDPADELSPEPLNANARKVEEILAAKCSTYTGEYRGTGEESGVTVELGRRPALVILAGRPQTYGYPARVTFVCEQAAVMVRTDYTISSYSDAVTFTDTGFTVNGTAANNDQLLNVKDTTYHYLALC